MIVGCLEKWGSTCYFRENDAPISIIFSDKTSGLLASFFATSGRIYTSQVGIDTNWGKIHLETMYFCYKWEASHFASPHLQVRCSHHESETVLLWNFEFMRESSHKGEYVHANNCHRQGIWDNLDHSTKVFLGTIGCTTGAG